MISLYQFEFSHFCEKARWALDYKGLAHARENLLPGLHTRVARKLAPNSSLPILAETRIYNAAGVPLAAGARAGVCRAANDTGCSSIHRRSYRARMSHRTMTAKGIIRAPAKS